MKSSDRRIHFSSIPPWPSRGGFLFAFTAALLLGQALGQAQDLRLTVKTGSTLEFTWRLSSVTLAESPQIIPDTQLETSADLKNWQPLGQAYSGGLDTDPATITQAIPPTDSIRYFRIRAQVNLPKANLAKRNLVGADLRGANLAGANLNNADLAMANLNGANLLGADLTGANLAETTLGNVDFTDADLTDASIGPWFNFPETVYHNTTMPDASIRTHDTGLTLLIQLYVDGAHGMDLSGKDFSGWDLRGVELQGRDLTGANFTGSDLRNVKLDRARLAKTNLSQANLQGATGFDPDDHKGITLKKTILPDGTTSD